MSHFADLDRSAYEQSFNSPEELRAHRKRRLALGYRIFGAHGWGSAGDGHISARDPVRTDCFWLARYGVPFSFVTVNDLVLVGPDGELVEGAGRFINRAAYYIHMPIHEARPDIVSAAHVHTPYGTPFSAQVRKLEPVSQEACAFFESHEIFDDDEIDIRSTDGGKRIAATLGPARAAILRNHGLLTVGQSVDAAVGYFVLMERSAEAQVKAGGLASPVAAEAARRVREGYGEDAAWLAFEWLVRRHVPEVDAVL